MQQTVQTEDLFRERKSVLAQVLTAHEVKDITAQFDDEDVTNLFMSIQCVSGVQFRSDELKVAYLGRSQTLEQFLKGFAYEIGTYLIDGFGQRPGTFGKMIFSASGSVEVEAYLRALPEFEEYTV
jgi:hypothetical protein